VTFRARRERKRGRIEIIPMIDTMFFLLVFFMLSSLSLTNLLGMPVNLPKSSHSEKQNKLDFTISIDKSGNVFVNRIRVTADSVGSELVALAGGPHADLTEASVVINADEEVPYGTVIHCIDAARGVGVTHFPLATAPDGTGS
jgi:biopolymer transport protein ExbD